MPTQIQLPASFRTTGTNLVQAKSHNHRVVLEVVRTRGPLSRADIARITLLSRQTIQNIVAELEEDGLVTLEPNEKTGRKRGHPGVGVNFRADGGFALGIHLDQFSLVAVLTNLSGEILWEETCDVIYPDPETAAGILKDILAKLERERPEQAERLVGIGLALPGPFNVAGVSSLGPTALPRWAEPEVPQWLSDTLGLPVIVENDASAASVGEHQFGTGHELDSYAYIYFGLGLGAGLHLNGSLYAGGGHNAGEIGHMIVDPDGRECPCGNRGCLERYVSLQAIYDAIGMDNPNRESIKVVERLFREEDPRIMAWLDSAIPRLRLAINILESVLDTDAIMIGGRLPRSVLEVIISRLEPLHATVTTSDSSLGSRVMLGACGPNSTALGAAALAVFSQLSPQVDMLLKC
ncbi:ROK family transcriptional regulator [Pseudodesulfovibrio tunisiensis]|uniref:ROK family transcriptional regulator n=1 Tax=Pseudodesulfovibrio tunisiensis TaxID=463192 RepID=UPI001FB314E0|nr:ROK family transcriptional regulator [Pseudodesulfovibrio tunisiensis]